MVLYRVVASRSKMSDLTPYEALRHALTRSIAFAVSEERFSRAANSTNSSLVMWLSQARIISTTTRCGKRLIPFASTSFSGLGYW